jgi:uncharacterized protein (TIGR00369 family)
LSEHNDSEQQDLVAFLNNGRANSVLELLGVLFTEASPERVVATMPIDSRHHQVIGYLHGGVSVVLAETVASVASILHIDTERQVAFGLEINANHVRPKRDGEVKATATPLHLGRTTHIWDVRITDEGDRLICVSRCTVAVVDRPPESKTFP